MNEDYEIRPDATVNEAVYDIIHTVMGAYVDKRQMTFQEMMFVRRLAEFVVEKEKESVRND